MKLFYLLICTVLLFSCQKENEYLVEDTLYRCMVDEFDSREIDFVLELKKLETSLLKDGILKSSSPESYIELNGLLGVRTVEGFEKIRINTRGYSELSTFFQNRTPHDVCLNNIDSNVVKKSRFHLMRMSSSPGKAKFDLTIKDVNNKYYKAKILMTVLLFNLLPH